MLAALIALLIGGAALALGGGGSGTNSAAATPGRSGNDDDEPGSSLIAQDDESAAAVVAANDDDLPQAQASEYALGWNGLSAEEQMMVELINRARMDVSEEVSRLNEGLASGITGGDKAPLAVVETLSHAARDHSENMDNLQFFDHRDPAGDDPWDRAVDAGHSTTYVGENIAVISSFSQNFDRETRVEDLHHGLWDSDGHQRNMLRDDWSEIGVGYDYGSYGGLNGGTYVTTKFSDTGETYLTGVVIDDEDRDQFYDIGEGQGGVRVTAVDQNNPENVYATSTWESGGYTLALPAGTYRVVFEGGDLDAAQEATVVIGNENVKLDVFEDSDAARSVASAMFTPAEESVVLADVLPLLPELDETLPEDFEDEDLAEPVLL